MQSHKEHNLGNFRANGSTLTQQSFQKEVSLPPLRF